ncbi:MAG: tetratricopeptide repeat-containing glycosyltransferase family protein [Burkholderiales bacterium]
MNGVTGRTAPAASRVDDRMQMLRELRGGEALAAVQDALARDPSDARLLGLRGGLLHAMGRTREACRDYRAARDAGTLTADELVEAGDACLELEGPQAALTWYAEALQGDPCAWSARCGVAACLVMTGRHAEARQEFERALSDGADRMRVLLGLADCALAGNALTEAEQRLAECAAIDPESPVVWTKLGVVFDRRGRADLALDACRRAAAAAGGAATDTPAALNLAIALRNAGEYAAAIDQFERVLPEQPTPLAHFVYSGPLLATGRLAEGWLAFEFRWMNDAFRGSRYPIDGPEWNGQDLRGKSILLCVEQGYGDAFQFIRYAPLIKSLGAHVDLLASPEIADVCAGAAGIDRVLRPGDTLPEFDFHARLMSLARVFGTLLDTIPAGIPYLFADPARVARWADRCADRGGGLKVGVVWEGRPTHADDRRRSLAPELLEPWSEVRGVQWYSLQKGAAERTADAAVRGLDVVNLGPQIADFADTAAVIEHLDLVVCVDTSVAHLAGAMGKPVWALLPEPADWRWLVGRDDSPWYPTLRLFRQRLRGDWTEVVLRVALALDDVVRRGGVDALPVRPVVHTASLPLPMNLLPRNVPGHRPGRSALALTRHGQLQFLPDEPEVGDALGWYGEWREAQLRLLLHLVPAGAVLLEVEAGVGAHAVPLGRRVGPEGHLLVSEARDDARRILRHNLAWHRVAGSTVLRERLGVDATVDALWLERLDWLKVTGAAAGEAVVEGAERTLWRCRPALHVAASDDAALVRLAERAGGFGYRCWRHSAALDAPENFNRRSGDLFEGRMALALLAIPEELDVDVVLDGCVEIS